MLIEYLIWFTTGATYMMVTLILFKVFGVYETFVDACEHLNRKYFH